MSKNDNKTTEERLDKIVKRLDILTAIALANSGLTRKVIAQTLGVSEKTIERLIPLSKMKRGKSRKAVHEEESEPNNVQAEEVDSDPSGGGSQKQG